jgi:organic hydroperoxide reductase OsmC/OhrA
MSTHLYHLELEWTGNTGVGTTAYTSYERGYNISIPGKPVLQGSSDPIFRGDPTKYNPEDLLVISLSSCHMLWYLHLCAVNDVVVEEYKDFAEGKMELDDTGNGRFTEVVLKPQVKIKNPEKTTMAMTLHHEAHKACFIAKSVNFPVLHQPSILV